jgi:hypothetical protein
LTAEDRDRLERGLAGETGLAAGDPLAASDRLATGDRWAAGGHLEVGSFALGHLAAHPLAPPIAAALGVSGYQLLADIAGVGAGRLGSHAFLLVAPDPDPRLPDAGPQLSLHHARLREDREASTFIQLAAQLGYLRLSGYRLVLERSGLRSKVAVIDPGTGAILIAIPERHARGPLGRGATASRLLAAARALPPAGAPADPRDSDLLRQVLVALALQDEQLGAAEAVAVAERALELVRSGAVTEAPAALEAAKRGAG